jgi:hypothetical protein
VERAQGGGVDVGLSGASGRTPSWGWITSTGWGSAGNGHGRVTPGPEAREALKKLAATVDAAKAEALDPAVEVWAFDGHRLGLKLLIRRVWARRGQRPVALSTHKYKWLYLYDFARPEWWLATSVNVPLFQGVRDGFAATVGAGPDKTAIVCSNGAAGMSAGGFASPTASGRASCGPTPRTSNPPNTSGRSPMKPSPTGRSPFPTNSPMPSTGDVRFPELRRVRRGEAAICRAWPC